MALNAFQTSFSGGEISPTLYARVDLAKWKAGAASMNNFFVDYKGGASNRQGTQYIDNVSGSGQPRLIPFVVNPSATYVCVFLNNLVKFYANGAYVGGADLVVPYTTADLPLLKYAQSADVLTICHPSYPPANITRTAPTTFTYTPLTYGASIDPPTALTGTPGVVNWSDAIYSYVVTAVTQNGKEESIASNRADVLSDAPGHNDNLYPQVTLKWTAPSEPVAYYNIYKAGPTRSAGVSHPVPVNTVFGYLGQSEGTSYTDTSATTNAPDFSHAPPQAQDPFSPGQVSAVTVATAGTGYTGYIIALIFSGGGSDTRKVLPSGYAVVNPANGSIVSVVITNFGRYMTVAPGCTDSVGSATYTVTLGSITGTFPFCVTYFQQRRCFGGTTNFPESVVMSQPGAYDNFNTSAISEASDAITVSIASTQNNTIKSMVAMPTGLVVFTDASAFLVTGGSQFSAVTPSTVTALPQASGGANDLVPLLVNSVNPSGFGTGGNLLYNTARGNTVRDFQFSFYSQSYTGTDRSLLASHLFINHELIQWCYAEEPDRAIYAIRDDGVCLCLTYVPEQEIYAWTPFSTQGLFLSVCSVYEVAANGESENAVYFIVQRYVNGAWVYYLERLAQERNCCLLDSWFLDAALALPQISPPNDISITGNFAAGGNVTITSSTPMQIVVPAQVFSTPGDYTWTNTNNLDVIAITAIGGGAGGNVWVSPITPHSGGGAAYAHTNAAAVTHGTTYNLHVGAGGIGGNDITLHPGEDTWFGSSNVSLGACLCLAQAGGFTGGTAAASKGDVKFNGGTGQLNNLDFPPGTSGGGAGGPNGAGADGAGAGGTGNGGQGGNGFGGLGGVYAGDGQPGVNGANGTEIDGVHGSGGGGSAGHSPGTPNLHGGNGGLYGGGGGTGPDQVYNGVGGAGAGGLLIIGGYTLPLVHVNDIIRVGCGLVQVTQVVTNEELLGTVVKALTPEINTNVNIPPLAVSAGNWTLTTPVTTVSGLAHLNGMAVNAIADGVPVLGLTVVAGSVTLPTPATNIIVGLAYTSALQQLYLDEPVRNGSMQGQRKLVPTTVLRLECTSGISVGTDFSFLATAKLPTSALSLFSGDFYMALSSKSNDLYGQICVQQTLPLPCSVLGISREWVPGDTAS